jgi:hypothetical protein
VVNEKWLDACIQADTIVSESDFVVRGEVLGESYSLAHRLKAKAQSLTMDR